MTFRLWGVMGRGGRSGDAILCKEWGGRSAGVKSGGVEGGVRGAARALCMDLGRGFRGIVPGWIFYFLFFETNGILFH